MKHPLFTCSTAHLFSFHFKPTHSMSSLTDLRTLRSVLSDAANTFKSSMYKRSVIFRLIAFDNLYPSAALRFQAIRFRHKVRSLRQDELSCCNPLWKIIISDVSVPYLVLTTIRYSVPPTTQSPYCYA